MKLSSYLDHTLLKPEATEEQINQVIQEAKTNEFASVMVNPYWVKHVSDELKNSTVKTATVIGFPLGANTTAIKVAEAKQAIADGADEIDMVINIGELKANHLDQVKADVEAVVEVGHAQQILVKVIVETALLTEEEKVIISRLLLETDADFIKTSTGFASSGAKVADIQLIKSIVGDQLKIKASGGIHTKEEAEAMISAGASRLGTSASVAIIRG